MPAEPSARSRTGIECGERGIRAQFRLYQRFEYIGLLLIVQVHVWSPGMMRDVVRRGAEHSFQERIVQIWCRQCRERRVI